TSSRKPRSPVRRWTRSRPRREGPCPASKTKGVDLVIANPDFLRTDAFLGEADTAKFKPKYTVSDLGLLDTAATTSFYPASQWAGTTGITAYVTGSNDVGKEPSAPAYDECKSIYDAHGAKFGQ